MPDLIATVPSLQRRQSNHAEVFEAGSLVKPAFFG